MSLKYFSKHLRADFMLTSASSAVKSHQHTDSSFLCRSDSLHTSDKMILLDYNIKKSFSQLFWQLLIVFCKSMVKKDTFPYMLQQDNLNNIHFGFLNEVLYSF